MIPPGSRVLDIGCGVGDTLASLAPSHGVGIDFCQKQIAIARQRHPGLAFVEGDAEDTAVFGRLQGPFDYILVLDTIGSLEDFQKFIAQLHPLCTRDMRLVIGHFSHRWYPLLKMAELKGVRMPQPDQNVLSPSDLRSLAELADFDPYSYAKLAADYPCIIVRSQPELDAGNSIGLLELNPDHCLIEDVHVYSVGIACAKVRTSFLG